MSPQVECIACVELDLAPHRRSLPRCDGLSQTRIRVGLKTDNSMRKCFATSCVHLRHHGVIYLDAQVVNVFGRDRPYPVFAQKIASHFNNRIEHFQEGLDDLSFGLRSFNVSGAGRAAKRQLAVTINR
jgi:hypothetical protein